MTTSQAQSRTKKKSKPSEANGAGAANGAPLNMFGSDAGATNLLRGGTQAMEHWVAGSQELARFYSTRMKKGMSAMSAFASCRTPQDFTEVWSNAASDAVHDYAEEFDRVLTLVRPE